VLLDLDRSVQVGEPEPEPEHDTESLVDWLYDAGVDIDPTTEEYAISAAASLARHFLDQGKSVGLIAYGQRRTVLPPDRGDRQVAKILSNLAVLRAAGRAGLGQVLATESHEFSRNTTLIVVTPSTSVRWIDALRELRHRGVGSLVVAIDAASFGAAHDGTQLRRTLATHRIPTRTLRCGDDMAEALEG